MPAPVPLSPDRLSAALAALPGWRCERDALVRTYRFAGFAAALAWMQDAGVEIERLDHHPEWTNVYDRVMVRLSTHDAGGTVTQRDVELAKILQRLAEGHGAG